jgi:1,4-alpha-glucan branching enzyme
VDADDTENGVITYMRRGRRTSDFLIACNFTPMVRENYRVGVNGGGLWREVLNTDAQEYGGSGQGNMGGVKSMPVPMHGRMHSVNLRLPPLAAVIFRHEPDQD